MRNQDDPLPPPVLWIKENQRRVILTFYDDILKLLKKDLITHDVFLVLHDVFLVLLFSSAQFVDPIVETANQYLRGLPFFRIGCLDLSCSIDQPHPIYRQAEYHQQVWLKLVANQWHEIAPSTTAHWYFVKVYCLQMQEPLYHLMEKFFLR